MPRLLYFYLGKRVAMSALLIETGLCLPVVLGTLFHQLPAAAIRGGLLIPALSGTLPTVLYVALPMAIGIAVALEFARMSSEGMIAVLYSLRLSTWSICLPSILVATIAVIFGYWLSTIVAPANAGKMHDVIHVIQESLNHRMLEPGRFYRLDNGFRTLFFERWRTSDIAIGMYIHQFSEKNEEQIINAAETEFRRNETGVVMILSNGSIQTRPEGGTTMQNANFDRYVIPINMQGAGGLPPRSWRGAFELSFQEFINSRPGPILGPRAYAEWMSEGTKRFGIPIMALTHALLAMGLILNTSSATGRRSSAATTTAIAAVPAFHIAIMVGAESLVRQNPQFVWLIASAIAAEFIIAILLIQRQNMSTPARRIRALAPQAA